MRKQIVILLVFFVALSACSQGAQIPQTTESGQGTASTAPPRVEPVASVEPTAPVVPPRIPETAGGEARLCVQPQPAAPLAVNYPEAAGQIAAFLNQGGTPAQLDQDLYEAGVLSLPLGTAEADLNGDGWLDVVVSLYDPASSYSPPEGTLLIYVCQENTFQLVYQQVSAEFTGGQGLVYVQDLNGDGMTDLLTSSSTCGAHTCYEDIQLLVWSGVEFSNRLAEPSSELPYPETKILDPDGDGIFDLEVTASGIGSVGAGPQRGKRWIWRYQPDNGYWAVVEKTLLPSSYRVHVLHDALQAAREQDFNQALLGFQRVISDASLEDWGDPAAEQVALAAYARLQMITIFSQTGQGALAQAVYQEMAASLGSTAAEAALASLAQGFLDLVQDAEVSAACVETRSLAGGYELELTGALGTVAFGYGNPEFAIKDICAWMP